MYLNIFSANNHTYLGYKRTKIGVKKKYKYLIFNLSEGSSQKRIVNLLGIIFYSKF